MSKLTKKDFDDYLGKDEFYNENDKERFYRNIHPSKGWRRHWIPQTLTTALIIGILIVGVHFFKGELPIASKDNNDEVIDSYWINAESTDDVEDFYESTVPGFKIAKELNQVLEVNQNYPLDDHGSLYIDKVWYHQDKMHLFYSMDIADEAFDTGNKDVGSMFDFLLQADGGISENLTIESPSPWSGVLFQNAFTNKIYRVATITLKGEGQLIGENQLAASFSINANDNKVNFPEIKLPVSYGSGVISFNEINETTQTKNSRITLTRVDYGPEKGYVFGSIDSDLGQETWLLDGKLIMNGVEIINVMDRAVNLNEGEFVIEIPELATANVSINLHYLLMIDNENTIDIPIDVSKYDPNNAEEKTMNQKVDTVGNTDVFLRNLHFDDQGVTAGFSVEKVDIANSAQIEIASILPKMEGWADDAFPTIISATDNNGNDASENEFYSLNDEIGVEIYKFGILKSFIEDKKEINVSIRRLSFGEELDWTIEIPKQK